MRPVHRQPCGPGQESVWDYPRPPRLEPAVRRVRVRLDASSSGASSNGVGSGGSGSNDPGSTELADAGAGSAWRVVETSHPPTYYVARSAVQVARLRATEDRSWCEFKGEAVYYDAVDETGRVVGESVAWSYPLPHADYAALAGAFAFYPGRVACRLDDEPVRPQAGGFYGGWITDDIVGPFKGEHGTAGW